MSMIMNEYWKDYEIILIKCVQIRCPHCKDRPNISINAWSYILERELKWANQMESMEIPGHYQTICEIENLDSDAI